MDNDMATSVKKIVVVHTSFVSVEDLKKLFSEIIPEAKVHHIVDDTLLPEVLDNRGVTDGVRGRMARYAEHAAAVGADLVFNQCSSVGEAADEAAKGISVPLLKIDEEMAERAVALGRRIAVVATLETTLHPTVRLIERKAAAAGRTVDIERRLCAGAFQSLIAGDRARHNAIVLETIREVDGMVDAIVLAQGSMAALLPDLGETRTPVLTSPRSGVERARRVLGL